jgi:fermentation-respiration switch protein FrsA (DUF1100 family)
MSTSAETLTAVMRGRAERERHRLTYAYRLGWLVRALRMPDAWRETNADVIHDAAVACREERAAALGLTVAQADARHGTVLEVAAWVVHGEGMAVETIEDAAEMLDATIGSPL